MAGRKSKQAIRTTYGPPGAVNPGKIKVEEY
jgi:hypothetical protein